MSPLQASGSGPLPAYRARRITGKLKPDPAQELAAEKLQSLYLALDGYELATPKGRRGFFHGWRKQLGFAGRRPEHETDPPPGLYLYGSVGRGKSMLMDLFYDAAKVQAKRRVHFHAFMLEVHAFLHDYRNDPARKTEGLDAAIPAYAEHLAEQAALLCFDEFHVADVADAMIMGRLFTALFERGVVVVATSNFAPDELYENGLQRDRFLPFIDLLKRKMDVMALEGGTDHRLARIRGRPVFHWPDDAEAQSKLEQAFADLTDDAPGASCHITISLEDEETGRKGRKLPIPRAAHGVAFLHFSDLTKNAVGPAGALAMASRFRTVILADIPLFTTDMRNEAKRLITFIDALYEHRTKLIASMAATPDALYPQGPLKPEFDRTVSRLMEMQSTDYLEAKHLT